MVAMLLSAALDLSVASPDAKGDCRVLLVPKQAGQDVELSDTAPAQCIGVPKGKRMAAHLVYDVRKRVLRAGEPLAAGQDIGRVYFPPRPQVRAGDRIAFSVNVGHVTIERNVLALQDADRGQHVFVRDPDGQIFAIPAPLQEHQP